MSSDQNQLRLLPSIDELLQSSGGAGLIAQYSRSMTLRAIRAALAQARLDIFNGSTCPSSEQLLVAAKQTLQQVMQPHLRSVINATGVIINTNLGRSPLSQEALQAVQQVAGGYSNLEYDVEAGKRGSRHTHVTALLRELTGAEAALVTNNNAAAVLLALSTLAMGREVIISRGQLVEIGGGFRVPDVMRQSGCLLVEVGTTNRTRVGDYEAALSERSAVLLTVHPSNFVISGFTESTPVAALAELAHRHNLLVMDDLGSGCLLDSAQYGLAHEPMPQESLAAGADVVCFSGDKLLGGPQAGILLGRADLLETLRRNPLARALRVDKMQIAALEGVLRLYTTGRREEIPMWRLLRTPSGELRMRSSKLARQLPGARARKSNATVGGGSVPGYVVPSWAVEVQVLRADAIAARLREGRPPVFCRVEDGALVFDRRTVPAERDADLCRAIRYALEQA